MMLEWVAVGLAVAVLYPFGAGMVFARLRPDGNDPGKEPAPKTLMFTTPYVCGCEYHIGLSGGSWTARCAWHRAMLYARVNATLWPLWLVTRATTITVHALLVAPRAMFRLGAGRLGNGRRGAG